MTRRPLHFEEQTWLQGRDLVAWLGGLQLRVKPPRLFARGRLAMVKARAKAGCAKTGTPDGDVTLTGNEVLATLTLRQLRAVMAHCLDIVVPSRIRSRPNGPQTALSSSQCVEAITRRRHHIEGVAVTEKWAQQAARAGFDRAAQDGHAFWHDSSASTGEPIALPDVCVDGLRSAVHRAGLRVKLWCYQELSNPPDGVSVGNAGNLLASPQFYAALENGVRLVALADIVRVRAVSSYGGWFLDCDTLWIRQLPTLVWSAPTWGHMFASLRARHDPRISVVKAALGYLQSPGDELHIATPFHCPPTSPLARTLKQRFEKLLTSGVKSDYNVCMSIVRETVTEYGLEAACVDPSVFSPLPYWLGRGVLSRPPAAYGNRLERPFREILRDGVAVNAFWQSGRLAPDATATDRGHLNDCVKGSLWHELRQAALNSGGLTPGESGGLLSAAVGGLTPIVAEGRAPSGGLAPEDMTAKRPARSRLGRRISTKRPVPVAVALPPKRFASDACPPDGELLQWLGKEHPLLLHMLPKLPSLAAEHGSMGLALKIVATAFSWWEGLSLDQPAQVTTIDATPQAWVQLLLYHSAIYWDSEDRARNPPNDADSASADSSASVGLSTDRRMRAVLLSWIGSREGGSSLRKLRLA